MTLEKDMFVEFTLTEPIDCTKEMFAITAEQQGLWIQKYRNLDYTRNKFEPSKFAVMLIREVDEETKSYELLEHRFDSDFKLPMDYHGGTLEPGKYIVMVAPRWHKSASLSPSFKQVLAGIYAPVGDLKLTELDRNLGYSAMARAFSAISEKKETLKNFQVVHGRKAPEEYRLKCYRDVDEEPAPGVFGYICYRNQSPHPLELKLQITMQEAVVVWPTRARDGNSFALAIEPKGSEVLIFRKDGDPERFAHDIATEFIPRRLERAEIAQLIKQEKETNAGFAKAKSFYKYYNKKEHSSIGFYFQNKSTTHDIFIKGELILQNMEIRDRHAVCAPDTASSLSITLAPGKDKLVIIDAIDRGAPYSFVPKLEFDRKQAGSFFTAKTPKARDSTASMGTPRVAPPEPLKSN